METEKMKIVIRNEVARLAQMNESEIMDDDNFTDKLGMDSLDCVELVIFLEGEFNIVLPEDIAENILTVNDAVDVVKKAQSGYYKQ